MPYHQADVKLASRLKDFYINYVTASSNICQNQYLERIEWSNWDNWKLAEPNLLVKGKRSYSDNNQGSS